MSDLKELKNKIHNRYGIVLSEDDPAWLMIVIYNDLLKEVNKSIDDLQNMPKITEANKSILTALNELQIKTSDLFNTADTTTAKISSENRELISNVKSEIEQLNDDIGKAINEAVNGVHIDTSKLEKLIREKIGELDVKRINNFIENTHNAIDRNNRTISHAIVGLENGNALISDSVKQINASAEELDSRAEEINDVVNNINSINRSVTMGVGTALLIGGLVVGFGVATYFKIDAVSDFYFSHYDKVMKNEKALNNDLIEQFNELNGLQKFLQKNGVSIKYGHFIDTKQPFISIKNYSDLYKSNNGNAVTVLQSSKRR